MVAAATSQQHLAEKQWTVFCAYTHGVAAGDALICDSFAAVSAHANMQQVMGNHTGLSIAGSNGHFELSVLLLQPLLLLPYLPTQLCRLAGDG
jgi:hypothetical protein